jgi:mRNA interferase RelE/StbE
MSYIVNIRRSAEKELQALPLRIHDRVAARLLALEDNPRPAGISKLQGEESYRLRIGDYRILLSIDDQQKQITIYAIGHRREVYR